MKVTVATLISLPLVIAAITPANAFDTKSFFGQLDRQSGGANGG